MEFIRRVARNYWLVYYIVYIGGVAAGLGCYWSRLGTNEGVLWLAAIFGAAAGTSLLAAILLEVIGRMVLLIPAAIKKYREEGREQGRKEGRREERRRIVETLRQLGTQEDGSVQITLTPDILKILLDDTDARS